VSGQQFVILSPDESSDNGLAPMGSRADVVDQLGRYNTAPQCAGEDILYGPGIRIELPPGEPVTQMLMTIVEEEIAWQVIMRLARALRWRLLDPTTGRELVP
jgi:hypothetical protein